MLSILLLAACFGTADDYDTGYDSPYCDITVYVDEASCGSVSQGVAWALTDALGDTYYSVTTSGDWAIQSPGTEIYGSIYGGSFSMYGEWYWNDGSTSSSTVSAYCEAGTSVPFYFTCS